jgi:hypothetical protein
MGQTERVAPDSYGPCRCLSSEPITTSGAQLGRNVVSPGWARAVSGFRAFTRHRGTMTSPLLTVLCDAARFLMLCLRPTPALAAENLFLCRQLAQYQERQVKPRRANDATRIALVWLSCLFDWRKALVIVQPATLIRWHRQGFRWFWRWRSKPGRPALPKD